MVKNLPANARDTRDEVSVPGRKWQPHQYTRLEDSTDKGAWQPTTLHGVRHNSAAECVCTCARTCAHVHARAHTRGSGRVKKLPQSFSGSMIIILIPLPSSTNLKKLETLSGTLDRKDNILSLGLQKEYKQLETWDEHTVKILTEFVKAKIIEVSLNLGI